MYYILFCSFVKWLVTCIWKSSLDITCFEKDRPHMGQIHVCILSCIESLMATPLKCDVTWSSPFLRDCCCCLSKSLIWWEFKITSILELKKNINYFRELIVMNCKSFWFIISKIHWGLGIRREAIFQIRHLNKDFQLINCVPPNQNGRFLPGTVAAPVLIFPMQWC
jgi:hypothetical protein